MDIYQDTRSDAYHAVVFKNTECVLTREVEYDDELVAGPGDTSFDDGKRGYGYGVHKRDQFDHEVTDGRWKPIEEGIEPSDDSFLNKRVVARIAAKRDQFAKGDGRKNAHYAEAGSMYMELFE